MSQAHKSDLLFILLYVNDPPPTDMVLGHTFTALAPDRHRLRVFAPAKS